MMKTPKTATYLIALLPLLTVGCATRPRPMIISPSDECWIPPPENIPNDDLLALAKQLVEADQTALQDPDVTEDVEASRLREMWESVPEEMRAPLDVFQPGLIVILLKDFSKTKTAMLSQQRVAVVRAFHSAYTDRFLTKYDALYRQVSSSVKCRPLRAEEEAVLVSAARSAAVEAGNEAVHSFPGGSEGNPANSCLTVVDSVDPAHLAQIRETALQVAVIDAAKRDNPIDLKQCGPFAGYFGVAVEVEYRRAHEQMANTLTTIAKGMERRPAMERPYIASAAHLYALLKVLSDAQGKKIDIYRHPRHPALEKSLALVSALLKLVHDSQNVFDEEKTEYFFSNLKRAEDYLDSVVELLTFPDEKKPELDSAAMSRLEQVQDDVVALREKIVRDISQATSAERRRMGITEDSLNAFDDPTAWNDSYCGAEFAEFQLDISENTELGTLYNLALRFQDESNVLFLTQIAGDVFSCNPAKVTRQPASIDSPVFDPMPIPPTNGPSEGREVKRHHSGLPVLSQLPPWTAHFELPRSLTSALEARNVDAGYQMLRAAVARAGLEARVYQFGKRGLALVTQLEKIEDNGRPFPSEERWNVSAVPSMEGWSYFDRFFKKRTGRYRFFILLLTEPENFRHSNQNTNWEQAKQIIKDGEGMPRDEFLNQPFEGLKAAVVVYEYYRKDEHSEPEFVERRLPARRHAAAARLWLDNQFDESIDYEVLVASRMEGE